MLLFWSLLGAFIGYLESQRRGFSPVGGVLGGIVLGPLAFLMFAVDGIATAKEHSKPCPYCAERLKVEAVACKHCGRDISPRAVVQHDTRRWRLNNQRPRR